MAVTVYDAADVAGHQNVVEWFDSEPAVGDVAVDSRCRCGPRASTLEQHNGATNEPSTCASSAGPARTDCRQDGWGRRQADVVCSAVTADARSLAATAQRTTHSYS